MRYLMAMAMRNIRRNTRRSLLAVISVMLAIAFIVCMQGMIGGFLGSVVKNYTRNETGHVRITTKAFQEKYRFMPVTENVGDPQSIIKAIRNDPRVAPHVTTITERITFGVLLSNAGNNKTALAMAGDPAVEKKLLLLGKSILPGGRYISKERETIVGARIAQTLGFKVGDTMKVMAQGSDYALHMRKFVIVGIFKTGLKMLDDAVFQVPLSDARQLLRTGAATQQIIIMLDNYRRAEAVAAAIDTRLGDKNLAVTPWSRIGDYGRIVKFSSSVYFMIYAVVALLGAFIIGNIMMMVVLERRREIGVLKSMGFRQSEVLSLFVCEGMALGLIGSVAGTLLGAAISTVLHFHGIDFTRALGSVNMPMDNVVYFTISAGGLVQAIAIGTIVSALLSLVPSWQAARMNPVEAIKSI
jgi:putative ABC transport system permease protein